MAATCLIADDDPMIRQMLRLILQSQGWTGVAVDDGSKALVCLRRQRFDLVLLDVMMPGLDGLATLAALRRDEAAGAPRQRVAMLTAHEGADVEQRLRAAGADDYLCKPIDMVRVQALLNSIQSPEEHHHVRTPAP